VPDNDTIRTTVMALSRPHPSGGRVIERAAVLAAGAHSSAILTWIADRGEAEALAPLAAGQGLHSFHGPAAGADVRRPLRYIISAAALSAPSGSPDP
jgi:hypothetical protein